MGLRYERHHDGSFAQEGAKGERRYGIVVHEASVGRLLLNRLGFRRLTVRPLHPEGDLKPTYDDIVTLAATLSNALTTEANRIAVLATRDWLLWVGITQAIAIFLQTSTFAAGFRWSKNRFIFHIHRDVVPPHKSGVILCPVLMDFFAANFLPSLVEALLFLNKRVEATGKAFDIRCRNA